MKRICVTGAMALSVVLGFSQQRKMAAIGSSTTGGTGTYPLDSSWVRRFNHYYKYELGMLDSTYNYGVGGYSCYKGMPSSYTPPPNRPGPDPFNNVTAAINSLSDLPDPSNGVIIVNYPTNGYDTLSITEIMLCLQTIYDEAVAAGHRCYITTTQPRTNAQFGLHENKKKLADIKDSIINRFGVANTINFWDGFYNPADTSILGIYNAGDNIHLNNDGHRELFNRVVAKNVFGAVLPVQVSAFSGKLQQARVMLSWVSHDEEPDTRFTILRSSNGSDFTPLHSMPASGGPGEHRYTFTDQNPLPGMNYYRLGITEPSGKSYTKIISVRNEYSAFGIKRVYANRASQAITATVVSPNVQTVTIEVVSATGVRIKTFSRKLVRSENVLTLDVALLTPGVYLLRISGAEGISGTQAFAVQ